MPKDGDLPPQGRSAFHAALRDAAVGQTARRVAMDERHVLEIAGQRAGARAAQALGCRGIPKQTTPARRRDGGS